MMARSGLRRALTPLATSLQRVDVEAGVGLVENGELRFEHRHLENLVALLLAAGKTLVDGAVHHGIVHLEQRHLLLDHGHEVDGVEL